MNNSDRHLTIKQLTQAVGDGLTPRMVRHYHASGLLPDVKRSEGNYRLYNEEDIHRLQRIMALKQQGFQLSHIRKLLVEESTQSDDLTLILRQQYQLIIQKLARLRRTASALEGLLGRDRHCQQVQAEALAQLRHLEVESTDGLDPIEKLWESWDIAADNHPETFNESLQQLLPDLSERSEIEVDLLSKLVLASGDVSLVDFARVSKGAIAQARHRLKAGCQVVVDVTAVANGIDKVRLQHLNCTVKTLIGDPHITSAADAEIQFWKEQQQSNPWQFDAGCILVVGYAPSVLLSALDAIAHGSLQPALIIGMPIGFSHAPAAKRRLMRSSVPYITIEGSLGGGLLAAVALNALAESLIEKPDCHCYLNG
ncbi:MAG: precorrin-8X methylmutase [Hydrococcus sp. Prado102]|nr:precorrin-8X methylmutase [Hydrococcus sp. Prado102]